MALFPQVRVPNNAHARQANGMANKAKVQGIRGIAQGRVYRNGSVYYVVSFIAARSRMTCAPCLNVGLWPPCDLSAALLFILVTAILFCQTLHTSCSFPALASALMYVLDVGCISQWSAYTYLLAGAQITADQTTPQETVRQQRRKAPCKPETEVRNHSEHYFDKHAALYPSNGR